MELIKEALNCGGNFRNMGNTYSVSLHPHSEYKAVELIQEAVNCGGDFRNVGNTNSVFSALSYNTCGT